MALAIAVAAGLSPYCSGQVTGPGPGPDPTPNQGPFVLIGAGDIAQCGSPGSEATAKQLDRLLGNIFTAGDNAYFNGDAKDYATCYDPTWGRHINRTRPAPGNHEYVTPGAPAYFDYFGDLAGPDRLGYYSYALGPWTIFSLNSEISMAPNSPQILWLRSQLTATHTSCSAAIFHRPLFTSGPNNDNPDTRDLWRTLYEFNVDVIINGHDHFYERFAPQDPDGKLDNARGMREFIVGTGGASLYQFVRNHTNSEVRAVLFGVIKFTLQDTSYQWQFLPADPALTGDSGIANCH
jgi:hypothetical protein